MILPGGDASYKVLRLSGKLIQKVSLITILVRNPFEKWVSYDLPETSPEKVCGEFHQAGQHEISVKSVSRLSV